MEGVEGRIVMELTVRFERELLATNGMGEGQEAEA